MVLETTFKFNLLGLSLLEVKFWITSHVSERRRSWLNFPSCHAKRDKYSTGFISEVEVLRLVISKVFQVLQRVHFAAESC